ncbi:flagellin [Mobiluncus mulieris]|uniref:flagellin N-terminal helical domain-containing protein n=1 Tax=Mobiluncus mulieris TaxID=2052 RepID=UPI0021E33BD4|nr:flagellin [Mobiluncus mulieris]
MVVLPGSGSGWVSILGMLRLLIHPTGMCKMPGQGMLVGLAKSLEKLSSGFRINRAADDAAGLAISEGLRSQVGGNRQAVRNAQDGISVVQTAEGALNEVHSILQRMRELAVQGANDSNSADARNNINTELRQLRDELERIGNVTNFNGTKLLDGTASGSNALKFQVGANGTGNDRITVDFKDADVTAVSKFSTDKQGSNVAYMKADALAKNTTYTFNLEGKSFTFKTDAAANPTKESTIESLKAALKGKGIGYVAGGDIEQGAGTDAIVTAINDAKPSNGKYTLTIDGKKYEYDSTDKAKGSDANAIVQGLNEALKDSGYELVGDKVESADKITSFKLKATTEATQNKQVEFSLEVAGADQTVIDAAKTFTGEIGKAHGTGFEFTVGDDASITIKRADGKKIDVAMAHSITSVADGKVAGKDDAHVKLQAFDDGGNEITDVDKLVFKDDALTVVDHDSAQNLINVLDRKISSVSTARANIGAIQNRFEHTITNLNVAVENLAASESRIRDTDMAQEMMQFTRNQILSQAGTSMLAQANQVPQGVLSLLR